MGADVFVVSVFDDGYAGVLGVGIAFTVDTPMAFFSLRSGKGECCGDFGFGPGETWNRKDRGTIIILGVWRMVIVL